MKNFSFCVSKVLKSEGGFTNDPNDSGGPTNYGITIGDVRRCIKRNATEQDVKCLTVDQAKDIYKRCYWDSLHCDDLSSGVDYTCFDYGVNSGIGRPRKALQRFKSLSGTELIDAINNERIAFLKGLADRNPKDRKFLHGWLNRVERVRNTSKKMANKDYTVGPAAGSGTITIGIGLAQYFHQYEWYMLGSAFVAALVIGLIIHYIANKGK